jgi:hypothetical protein
MGDARAASERACVHPDWDSACAIPCSSGFMSLFLVRHHRVTVENKIRLPHRKAYRSGKSLNDWDPEVWLRFDRLRSPKSTLLSISRAGYYAAAQMPKLLPRKPYFAHAACSAVFTVAIPVKYGVPDGCYRASSSSGPAQKSGARQSDLPCPAERLQLQRIKKCEQLLLLW